MDLSIKIEEITGSQTKKADVEIRSAPPEPTAVINGLFQFFGVQIDKPMTMVPNLPAIKTETSSTNTTCATNKIPIKQERPRRLPIQRSEPFNVTIGERVGAMEPPDEPKVTVKAESPEVAAIAAEINNGTQEEPEFYKTGIKYKTDGTPLYKCRYECKNISCLKKGTKYIPEGTEMVTCHYCGTQLAVRLVDSEKGFGARDDWGNYYFADKLVPF